MYYECVDVILGGRISISVEFKSTKSILNRTPQNSHCRVGNFPQCTCNCAVRKWVLHVHQTQEMSA